MTVSVNQSVNGGGSSPGSPSSTDQTYHGTVADEAAMIALTTAIAGDECYRTDTATVWKLRVAPYSSAANWLNLGTGSSVGELASDAAIAAAAAGATLSGTPCYYMATDTGNVYWCPSASEAYFVVAGEASPRYLGRYTTVADLEAVATPAKGDQAMLDITGMPFPFFATYTGSAWRATAPLVIEVDGGAGTTSASEQCAASWIQEIPGGLLKLFRRMDVEMVNHRNNTTDEWSTLNLRLGSSSAGLTGAALITTSGAYIDSTNRVRDPVFSFSFNSTNVVQSRGSTNKGAGHYAGSAGTSSLSPVTLGGSDDFDDILYFSVTATMAGTSTTPSSTYALNLIP